MIRQSYLYSLFSLPVMCIRYTADLVCSIIAVPLMYLLKTITAYPMFNILSAIKLVAFRVIKQLKPVYRLSFLTDGLSLRHRRCLC